MNAMTQRLVVAAAAAGLLFPVFSVAKADTPGNPPAKGGPAKPGGGKPSQPAGKPGKPSQPAGKPGAGKPSAGKPGAGKPSAGKPSAGKPSKPSPSNAGKPGKTPQAGKPAGGSPQAGPQPPRGNQFSHRGQSYNRIAGPAFVYPPGWQYRRWSIGGVFPALFLTSAYFYADYAALGLEVPPTGYAWVRFGPDLVLVNLTTDEIEDVVYGVFM